MSDPAQPVTNGEGLVWPATSPAPNLAESLYEPLTGMPPQTAMASTVPMVTGQPATTTPVWLVKAPTLNQTPIYPAVVQNQALVKNSNLPGVYYPTTQANNTNLPDNRPGLAVLPPADAPVNRPRPLPATQPLLNYGEIALGKKPDINPPPTPPPAIEGQPRPVSPLTAGGKITNEHPPISWIIQALSLAYFICGGIFLGISVAFMTFGYLFNQILQENHSIAFQFLRESPLLGLIPLLWLGAALGYWWAATIIKDKTRIGWGIGLAIGICLPIIIALGGTWLWSQGSTFIKLAIQALSLPSFITPLMETNIYHYQLAFLLLPVITALSAKAFSQQNRPNNRSIKALLGLLTFFSIFIWGSLIGGAYAFALSNNFQYKSISTQADFHVYKPRSLPGGRTYKTPYLTNQGEGMLNGKTDFVQVTFDYPLKQQVTKGGSSPIMLRQVKVPQNFQIETFAASLLAGTASPAAVVVQGASKETGYTLETEGINGALRAITFTTPDNVLVFISSTKAQLNDLVILANNLE